MHTQEEPLTTKTADLTRQNRRYAKMRWGSILGPLAMKALSNFSQQFKLSVANGDLLFFDNGWYVTHSGLLCLARRKRCCGIQVELAPEFCDPKNSRWVARATVYRTRDCKGFVGHGDADSANVDPLLQGAEMRIAETRAVCRAIRKAYAVGCCSVEETVPGLHPYQASREPHKVPPQPPVGKGYGGPKLRDRLCQIIRQHQLDATLVKSYATDFCGVKALREATREQVENFVSHLADWADKDRNALLCQLNSYPRQKEGAA